MTAEELAVLFHANYERLAPRFGWTVPPWPELPARNRAVRVAAAAEVLKALASEGQLPDYEADYDAIRQGIREAQRRAGVSRSEQLK